MPQRAKLRRIKKRADYIESLDAALESGHIDLENLIFIDESGCKLGETSDYGYGQSGKRVPGAEQKHKGHNISVVSAISTAGVLSAMFCNCTFDASAFECFLESHLLPTLRPGNILILDNVGFHKITRFKESMKGQNHDDISEHPDEKLRSRVERWRILRISKTSANRALSLLNKGDTLKMLAQKVSN